MREVTDLWSVVCRLSLGEGAEGHLDTGTSLDTGTCETVTFLNVRKCAFCVQASAGDGQGVLCDFKQCLCLCGTDAPSPATGEATGGGFCSGSGCHWQQRRLLFLSLVYQIFRYLSQRNVRRMLLHVLELRFLLSLTQGKCVQSVGEKH